MTEIRKSIWKEWFKTAAVRALKTVCQTAIATIGTCAVMSDVDWVMVASASCLAGILSLLTSLAGIPEANDGISPIAEPETDAGENGGDR